VNVISHLGIELALILNEIEGQLGGEQGSGGRLGKMAEPKGGADDQQQRSQIADNHIVISAI
jgi:hypothetical protein